MKHSQKRTQRCIAWFLIATMLLVDSSVFIDLSSPESEPAAYKNTIHQYLAPRSLLHTVTQKLELAAALIGLPGNVLRQLKKPALSTLDSLQEEFIQAAQQLENLIILGLNATEDRPRNVVRKSINVFNAVTRKNIKGKLSCIVDKGQIHISRITNGRQKYTYHVIALSCTISLGKRQTTQRLVLVLPQEKTKAKDRKNKILSLADIPLFDSPTKKLLQASFLRTLENKIPPLLKDFKAREIVRLSPGIWLITGNKIQQGPKSAKISKKQARVHRKNAGPSPAQSKPAKADISCLSLLNTPRNIDYNLIAKQADFLAHLQDIVGCVIGDRYRIIKKIGQGGMGVVYQAYDQNLRTYVALKFLMKEGNPAASIARFQREAHILAQLNNDSFVTVHDIQPFAGHALYSHYIVMDYIEGVTLRDWVEQHKNKILKLKKHKKLRRQLLTLMIRVSNAISIMHEQRIIHRDIKPANIMVVEHNKSYYPIIMDFGLARGEEQTDLTLTESIMGTPKYMSPEQIQTPREVTHATDIYSFGAVLYYCVTTKAPIEADEIVAIIYNVMKEAPVEPIKNRADICPALEMIIKKAMAHNRQNRYQSANELTNALEMLLKGKKPKVHIRKLSLASTIGKIVWSTGILLSLVVVVAVWLFPFNQTRKTETTSKVSQHILEQQRKQQKQQARKEEATRLYKSGQTLYNNGSHEKAFEKYSESLALAGAVKSNDAKWKEKLASWHKQIALAYLLAGTDLLKTISFDKETSTQSFSTALKYLKLANQLHPGLEKRIGLQRRHIAIRYIKGGIRISKYKEDRVSKNPNDYKQALIWFAHALKLAPELADHSKQGNREDPYWWIARTYLKLSRYDDAIKAVLKANSKTYQMHQLTGDIYYQRALWKKARLEQAQDEKEIRRFKEDITNDLKKAIRAIKRSLRKGGPIRGWFLMGTIHSSLHQYPQAISYFKTFQTMRKKAKPIAEKQRLNRIIDLIQTDFSLLQTYYQYIEHLKTTKQMRSQVPAYRKTALTYTNKVIEAVTRPGTHPVIKAKFPKQVKRAKELQELLSKSIKNSPKKRLNSLMLCRLENTVLLHGLNKTQAEKLITLLRHVRYLGYAVAQESHGPTSIVIRSMLFPLMKLVYEVLGLTFLGDELLLHEHAHIYFYFEKPLRKVKHLLAHLDALYPGLRNLIINDYFQGQNISYPERTDEVFANLLGLFCYPQSSDLKLLIKEYAQEYGHDAKAIIAIMKGDFFGNLFPALQHIAVSPNPAEGFRQHLLTHYTLPDIAIEDEKLSRNETKDIAPTLKTLQRILVQMEHDPPPQRPHFGTTAVNASA